MSSYKYLVHALGNVIETRTGIDKRKRVCCNEQCGVINWADVSKDEYLAVVRYARMSLFCSGIVEDVQMIEDGAMLEVNVNCSLLFDIFCVIEAMQNITE